MASDLLTAIRISDDWAGAQVYYEKVRDRGSWDFALESVAAAFRMDGNTVADARIAVNGVAPYPVRLHDVERSIIGSRASENLAIGAGEVAVQGVRPLRHNDYKVPMMRNLVKRAVRSVVA